jgi:hypothetical protein
MRRLPLVVLGALMVAAPGSAQDQPVTVDRVIHQLTTLAVQTREKTSSKTPFSGAVSGNARGPILILLAGQLVDAEVYKTLTDVLSVSTGTQVGSTSETSGTTALTMKGLVPAILGFAVEHGAITQDVNGTVATFRVSPAGLIKALQGKELLDIYHDYSADAAYRFASRFSASASFDTSLGDSPGTLLADEQQLTAWSVTVVLFNGRDPRAKGYAKQWRKLGTDKGMQIIDASAALDGALDSWKAFTDWEKDLTEQVRREVDERLAADGDMKAAIARFRAIVGPALARLQFLEVPPDNVPPETAAYVGLLTEVVKARNDIYAYANEGALATFDWTTARDESVPDLYTLTAVYENSFTPSRKDDFTANAAFRFYRETPAGSDRRYKDFSLSAQWDRPLGRVFDIPFILTAAARYQYIPEDIPVSASGLIVPETIDGSEAPPAPTTGATAIAPKGHLIVGQAKLTIPLKNGVRIPLSVTVANRTELIEEDTVRANFGVTFDLDAFVAAFKARQ